MPDEIPGFPDISHENPPPPAVEEEVVTLTGRLELEDILELHEYEIEGKKKARDWRAGVMASSTLGVLGLLFVTLSLLRFGSDTILGLLFGVCILLWGIWWPWGYLYLARRKVRVMYEAFPESYPMATVDISRKFVSLSSQAHGFDLLPRSIVVVLRPAGLIFLRAEDRANLFYLPQRDLGDGLRERILSLLVEGGAQLE